MGESGLSGIHNKTWAYFQAKFVHAILGKFHQQNSEAKGMKFPLGTICGHLSRSYFNKISSEP